MAKPRIGIQLIVFGEEQETDIEGVFRKVAEAGYEGVEADNLFRAHGEDTIRKLLEETGLVVTGVHRGYGDLSREGSIQAEIDYLKAVGGTYLILKTAVDNINDVELIEFWDEGKKQDITHWVTLRQDAGATRNALFSRVAQASSL